ncbi:universal stress protein [Massilia sp. YIM B02763]|uniref:universal stress protein n=1 Tax=Massilia sp. YIM B02763 TaxID=3050130 RepID=UPI0025B72E4A|nr:universal stress protein [Massilia sp. YIM B02763]MDN4051500.1 universal stress protein [Massilia sp. YIM B02763]
MYKRILLPTDGSEASSRAAEAGVAFARELGADVVALNATPPFRIFSTDAEMLEDTSEQYAAASRERARKLLGAIGAAAHAAGVACRLEHIESDEPWSAIIDTAGRLGCDLIVMASHGRRGIAGLLLGSQTQKVLVHSTIPVLVHR